MNGNINPAFQQLQVITESFENGRILGFKDGQEKAFHTFGNVKEVSNDCESGNIIFLRVANLVTNHKNLWAQADLVRLQNVLDKEISVIEADTSGVIGFFRYFFSPSAKAEQRERQDYLNGLKSVVVKLLEKKVEKQDHEKINVVEEKEDNSVPSQPVINLEEKPQDEKPVVVAEPLVPTFQEPIVPIQIPTTGSPIPQPPTGGLIPPIGGGVPQPPRKAPPMLGRPLASKPVLTPEQKHNENQQRILERNLKERANFLSFYEVSPPKNEKELEKLKTQLEADIGKFNVIKGSVPEQMKKQIEGWIADKQKELDSVEEQLKGTTKAIKGLQEGHFSSEFLSKAQKLTNEEIKFILLQFFDGKAPSEPIANAEETNVRDMVKYRCYIGNKEFFDEILPEWDTLSASESGKAFAEHRQGWDNYLSGGVTPFIQVLNKRKLPVKNIDHLKTPEYKAVSFEEAQKKVVKKPVFNQNSESSGQLDLGMIQRGIKLRSAAEQKPLAERDAQPETLLDQIRKRSQ